MVELEKPNITKIDENKDYGSCNRNLPKRGYRPTLW